MLRRLGPGRRGAVLAGLAIVAAAPALSLFSTHRGPDPYAGPAPAIAYPAGTLVEPPRPLPSIPLTDEHGHATTLAAFRGRWLVLAPAMTLCREACPLTTATLRELVGELRREGLSRHVAVAEVTVDPWRDTPARLRAYRRLSGADFALMTGTPAEIHALWSFLGVFYERVPAASPAPIDWMTHRPETFDVQHTDGVFILDPSGRERLAEEGMAAPGAALPSALARMLDAEGRQDLAHAQAPWSAGELLADLGRLAGVRVRRTGPPAGAAAAAGAARPSSGARPSSAPAVVASQRAIPLRALATIRAEGGRLLGGYGALRTRLARLRGLPVVLNAWASWCPPCREELPIFSAVSRLRGGQVAFLGVDTDDAPGPARKLLSGVHVSYPSYQASLGSIDQLAPVGGTPTTIFLDPAGRVAYVHEGQYADRRELEEDVDRYARGLA